MSDSRVVHNHAAFIWSVADLLRGDYKQSEYGDVIMPLTVIRRLDCVLETSKDRVLAKHAELKDRIDNLDPVLCAEAGEQFYNVSRLDFRKLLDDPAQIADNLRSYIAGFSPIARDVIEKFEFDNEVTKMDRANLLYLVVSKFAEIDLHPATVSNLEMGYLYEELIRRFSELSNETAGEHFTPREVVRLMVNLLFVEDDDALSRPGVVRTIFDPACGTGGMLSVAEDHLRDLNPKASLEVFGQELNEATYAICRSDMMLKGQDATHITVGNSFSEDGHAGRTFDYCLANPPFGVEWKKVEGVIRMEHESLGYRGRFGAGLPRINDGSFLFLQHMMAKMKPVEQGGSRIAIVFNGAPLFKGKAGSGESEIRRWIIENDWLEAVVALPDQLFYNTEIGTYFWIVTNRKRTERRGKVQLIDAREMFKKMPRALGKKRNEIDDDQVEEITRLYAEFEEGDKVKVFSNEEFGFMHVTVERPLRLRWEVTDVTVDALRSSKVYSTLCREGWSDVPIDRTIEAFNLLLAKSSGASSVDLAEVETVISAAAVDTWEEMGWEVDRAATYEGPGSFAKAFEIKPAQARQILDCFAVRDEDAPDVVDSKGRRRPDALLRDTENVPLPDGRVEWVQDVHGRLSDDEHSRAIRQYLEAEVTPWVPEAWVDFSRTKIGYEVPLTRHFYNFAPPRNVNEIDVEIRRLQAKLPELFIEVVG